METRLKVIYGLLQLDERKTIQEKATWEEIRRLDITIGQPSAAGSWGAHSPSRSSSSDVTWEHNKTMSFGERIGVGHPSATWYINCV
jgi:hypothetical protein